MKLWIKYKIIILFILFIFLHYVFSNIYYDIELREYNIFGLIFFSLILLIYFDYRGFVIINLKKIIFIFIISLLLSFLLSFFVNKLQQHHGGCNFKLLVEFYLLTDIHITKIRSVIFKENSHLAIVLPAIIFYLIYHVFYDIKYLIPLIFLIIISPLILTTTYLAGLIISGILISIFIFKKDLNYKRFILINILLIIISFFGIISNKDCSKKITAINLNQIIKDKFSSSQKYNTSNFTWKNPWKGNVTSTIYERSIAVSLDTLRFKFLGWGYSNNDIAILDFLEKKNLSHHTQLKKFNLKDSAGNLFKLSNEFGFLIFFIFYYFFLYIFSDKKIKSYKIFFILLFVIQLCRGVGYLNGGFCLALFEILFYKKFKKNLNVNY